MTGERRCAVIALAVGSLGAAIPWGLATGARDDHIRGIEWVLSVALGLVAVALVVSMFVPRFRRWGRESLVLAAGAWTATSVMLGWLLPDAGIPARFGLGLMFASPAVLAFGLYISEVEER